MQPTVFITGATSGFGEACARRFALAGWKLVITGRRTDRLEALAAELSSTTEVLPLTLDVRDRGAMQAAIDALPDGFAKLRGLINNAGLALGTEPVPQARLDEWETMIATNVTGLVTVTHLLLPEMVARHSGTIINVGSIAGSTPYPGGNVYGATKAFVDQFSRNLRADLVGTGVRTTNLAPGLVGGSEFSQVRLRGNEAAAAKVYEGAQPLTPEDIADTAYWIATLPAHVNINHLEMMPICQGYGPLNIKRGTPA